MASGEGRSLGRLSLFYLATYLGLTGIAFLFAPEPSLRLLGAQRHYDPIFVRFTGAFMIALSTLVTQIIRHRLTFLHSTTIGVRIFFVAVIVWFYRLTGDPMHALAEG